MDRLNTQRLTSALKCAWLKLRGPEKIGNLREEMLNPKAMIRANKDACKMLTLTRSFFDGAPLSFQDSELLTILLSTRYRRECIKKPAQDFYKKAQNRAREIILDNYDLLVALPILEVTENRQAALIERSVQFLSGCIGNEYIRQRLKDGAKHPLAPVWLIPRINELESRVQG